MPAAARRSTAAPPPLSTRRLAVVVLGAFAAAMAGLLFIAHRVPLYGVETDLFGESIPAARALLAGHPVAAHYAFKGPGYPLLLAGSTLAAFGDFWIAARLLNLLGAVAGAALTYLFVRRAAGDAAGAFALLALCANPLYVRATLEAGTDVPTFALSIAATYAVLAARGPRAAALAGLLAGLAVLCRYNAAFLVPAGLAALLLARDVPAGRGMRVAAYGLGALLPLAPWFVLAQKMGVAAFGNANYANLAYELYGGGTQWDRFWTEVAPRFHSYADVVRYDPAAAVLHWLRNLATRWTADIRQLVPVWIGVAAVLGALIHARRAPRQAGLLVHFGLCYATLALVFYAPRFFLYLLPFYLACAALLAFPRSGPSRPAGWRVALAGLAIAASAALAVRETATLLRDTPTEIVTAGSALRALAQPGDRVVARKPQVAYFARMDFAPFPLVETVEELLAAARGAGARYVNLSGIEGSLRPQFRLLEQPDVHLPGLTLVARDVSDPRHYYALYRVEPASPADSAFKDSLLVALRQMALRDPDNAGTLAYAGATFLDAGRPDVALALLDRAVRLEPQLVQARGYRAVALYEAGRLDEAAHDCQQLLAGLARAPAAYHQLLGFIRSRQHRLAEAEASFDTAVRLEPANVSALLVLGFAQLGQGKDEAGRAAIGRAVRLAPGVTPLRDAALGMAARRDVAGLERLIEVSRRTLASGTPTAALVDSTRAGSGR